MAGIGRRTALRLIGGAPLAGFGLSAASADVAHAHALKALAAGAKGTAYKPRFFSPHEWRTVRALVDLIIPRDARSGSATDAGVPEFMDFVMTDPAEEARAREWRQTSMRGGLAWIDTECRERFGQDFVSCTEAQRTQLLDEIAYHKGDADEATLDEYGRIPMRHGASFFNSFRDLTASGFWSSKMGVADLGYVGNRPAVWEGPPAEVLLKLGLEGGKP
jgi:gluconate 2-dehydrogenase gamma chain